jgi:hypothetical protein
VVTLLSSVAEMPWFTTHARKLGSTIALTGFNPAGRLPMFESPEMSKTLAVGETAGLAVGNPLFNTRA